MIEFLVRVRDNGTVVVHKLELSDVRVRQLDHTFESAELGIDDRINLHVDTSSMRPNGQVIKGVKRLLTITVLDDEIPQFGSREEADQWMAGRSR